MKGTNAYNNGLEQSIPLIKPPRTGIEQVFISDRPRFIEATREFERLANVNPMLAEEYEQMELENGTG